MGIEHPNYVAKYVLPLSSAKVFSILTQAFCCLSFSLYPGSALLYSYGYFSTAEAKASSAFKLIFFIFLLLHCIYTHTHTHKHTFNIFKIVFVYLPIILLDLRHLISPFSLMLNNPFSFRANMKGIISKLFDRIPLDNRFEIKAIISKANMASISTEGNIFNPAEN